MKKIIVSIIVVLCVFIFGLTAWAQSPVGGDSKGNNNIVKTVINMPGQPSAEDIKQAKTDRDSTAQVEKNASKTNGAEVKTNTTQSQSGSKTDAAETDTKKTESADNGAGKTAASDIPRVSYRAHVQEIGWMDSVTDPEIAGITSRDLRMEAFKIKLANHNSEGHLEYRANIQDIGWESKWYTNDEMSGTVGKQLCLKGIQIRMTGALAKKYDVYYRVNLKDIGWIDWVKNGETAGSQDQDKPLEAIQIGLVEKDDSVKSMASRAIAGTVESAGPGTFKMAVETSLPDQIDTVKFHVQPDGGSDNDNREYIANTHQNGTWSAEATIADFGFNTGRYHITCDIVHHDGNTERMAISDDFEVEALPFSATLLEGTNTEYRLTINVPDAANIREVLFPIWTDENGQDDVIWHKANRVDANTFGLNLNIRDDHYNGERLMTHAILKDTDGADHLIGSLSTQLSSSVITQYIGHRGCSSRYPENSLAAFKNNQWQYAECDIWPTADNKWVVMHDAVIDRTTDGSGTITDMTLSDLRQYHIDTGVNIEQCAAEDLVIPTLSDYLAVCSDRGIVPVIEIKTETISDEAYANLAADLAEYGYDASNMVMISFFSEPLRQMESRYPGIELMYLTMSINDELVQTAKSISGNCAISSQYSGVTQKEIDLCHSNGIKAGVWTVPDDKCARFRQMKVDYITLN